MEPSKALDFSIDVFSPDTIPMERLAEYMLELSTLYGSQASVHLREIRQGSTVLNAAIDGPAIGVVEARLRLVHDSTAPADLRKAYQNLNNMLKKDGAVGEVRHPAGRVILEFPGRNTPVQRTYHVKEAGVLDGIVIRIGGKDSTIPVWLKDTDGTIHKCEANSELARGLIKHYLSAPVRVTGQGDWLRGSDGRWQLEKFRIDSWEVLENALLTDLLNVARLAKGNNWNEIDDPIKEHLLIRGAD